MKQITKEIIEALCEKEAQLSGVDTSRFMFGNDAVQYGVSGFDRELIDLIDAAPDELALNLSATDRHVSTSLQRLLRLSAGEDNQDSARAIYARVVANMCKAVAFSLGDITRLPFLQHESMSFRVSVAYGKQEEGVESNLSGGRLEIFLPTVNASDIDVASQAMALTRYGVVGSFMMHDESIRKAIAAGDKRGAAAAVISHIALSEAIVESAAGTHYTKISNEIFDGLRSSLDVRFNYQSDGVFPLPPEDVDLESPYAELRGQWTFPYADVLADSLSPTIGEVVYFSTEEAAGLRSYRDMKKDAIKTAGFSDFGRIGKNNYTARTHEKEYPRNVEGIRQLLSDLMQVAEEFKEKDDAGGPGDDQPAGGEGDSIADQIIRMIASEQGQEPGGSEEAQGEGQEEAEGASNEERRRMLGRFGSTEEGRRVIELLSDEVQERALIEESKIGWQDYLVGALLKSSGIDRVYNWSRPNRRHIGSDIYLPGFRRRKVRRLAVLIDESGSIDMDALMEFNSEFIRVIDIVNPEGVDIIHFSTTVAEETLSQGEAWEPKRMCNGGTRFSVAYDALAEHISNGQVYDAVIVFTDMEDSGHYGIKRDNAMKHLPEGMDWYFATFGEGCPKADFGTQISISTGEILEHE